MIGTYVSAALICAAALLVGRALFLLAGRRSWSWLEPAVGLGAVLTVTGVLARAPGHGTSATLGLALLLITAGAVVFWVGDAAGGEDDRAGWREVLQDGLPVALAIGLVLSIPFAISARWGLLGVGFNNDLGLHLAWAEWLRSGAGPIPEAGYPLGPHGLAVAIAAVPGIGLGHAFVGEIFAIGIITGATALAALPALRPGRRLLGATLVAISYLGASYFAQGAFKELAQALFVLAVAVGLREIDVWRQGDVPRVSGHYGYSTRGTSWARWRLFLPWLALAGGIFFSYSFAGLAWPIAIALLWSLTLPSVRRALAPRALLRILLRPATLVAIVVLAAVGVAATLVGPFGFVDTFSKVAGTNTYGPVSPLEALGVWPADNYRLAAPGGVHLSGLAGAIGVLALLAGTTWWVRRRDLAVPLGLAACALLYLAALPTSGDYSLAKALMIAAPLAMLVAIRPLLAEFAWRGRDLNRIAAQSSTTPLERLAWSALAVIFIGGAVYSSFLALRNAPVAPPGHGAELRAFVPLVEGEPVLYAGQDRYAAYELMGADTHVPLVEFPDSAVSENPEKPFDTGDAYSPIDFDSFSRGTLDSFPYVVTGRAAWNSQAPRGFKRIAATPSFLLWKRTADVPEDRHVLLEGTDAGAWAGCAAPEIRILLSNPGRASLFPAVAIAPKGGWSEGGQLHNGERTAQAMELPRGRWHLSLQYFSPFDLTLSAPGFEQELKPALDGQRPNTISLANNGQFWPAGVYDSGGGRIEFTVEAEDANFLQRLSGYDDVAYVGDLVAVRAGERRIVPLRAACDSWIDWYESPAAP
jgi:hypothetical protein